MKNSLLSTISVLHLLTSLSAAASWPDMFGNKLNNRLMPRQNADPSSTAPNSGPATATVSNSQTTITSGSSAAVSASRASSKAASGSAVSGSAAVSASGSHNTTAIDPRLPPGGIQMLTPAATDAMTFLKVGNQITFAWNYTSLSVAPSYIDVIATNTVNSQTYTIAANTSWDATQTVVWDTGDYAATASLPFVVATYTLMVYDAASEPTAVAKAGYLGSFSNLQFGVYTPQAYTPLNDFRCATCSGAMSVHERQALSVILATCAITVFSFTWFASGFGLL